MIKWILFVRNEREEKKEKRKTEGDVLATNPFFLVFTASKTPLFSRLKDKWHDWWEDDKERTVF